MLHSSLFHPWLLVTEEYPPSLLLKFFANLMVNSVERSLPIYMD
jgi:hypothetical protein